MKQWIAIVILFVMIFPANAQGNNQPTEGNIIDLGAGYSVVLPDGWDEPGLGVSPIFEIDEDFSPVFLVNSNDLYVRLISPATLSELFEAESDLPLGDVLLLALATIYQNDLRGLGPETVGVKDAELDNYDGVYFPVITLYEENHQVERWFFAVQVDDSGSYLIADFYRDGPTGVSDAESTAKALLDAVVAGTQATASSSETTGEPCFVSTETARTATVRVGPGTNRTALMFLAVGEQFTVTGRFVATDDTVWYQLDKAEVDPTSDAAELWLAQADVDEVGDCDLVGETAAPPIRPILGGGGSSAGGGSGGGSAPAGTLPQSGTWTLTLGSRGLVSCLGTNTVEFNTSEVYGNDISDVYSLTSNSSANTFVMGGQLFTPLPSGAYTGALSFNNGSVGINFYVQNTGFMGGELVYNENIQGLQCSFTIPLSASRN